MMSCRKRVFLALALFTVVVGWVTAASAFVPADNITAFLDGLKAAGCEVIEKYRTGPNEYYVEWECPEEDPTAELERRYQELNQEYQSLVEDGASDLQRAEELRAEMNDLVSDIGNVTQFVELAGDNYLDSEDRQEVLERVNAVAADTERLWDEASQVGDPVRVAVGEFAHSETDVVLQYFESDLAIHRHYSSGRAVEGSFGPAWIFNFDTRVIRGIKANADEAARLAEEWAAYPQQLYESYDASFDEYLGDPDAQEVGSAEANLASIRSLYGDANQLAGAASALASDASGTSVEGDANNLASRASGYRNSVRSRRDALDAQIEELRALREDIERIPSQFPQLEVTARVARNEARLSRQAELANRYVVFPSAPSHHVNTGLGSIMLIDESGTPLRFTLNTSPIYDSTAVNPDGTTNFYPNGSMATPQYPGTDDLELLPDGSWVVTNERGEVRRYDYYGRITSIGDRNGNTLRFTYENERLAVIEDDYGRTLRLTRRPGDGLITRIDGPQGRSLEYGYDAGGRLAYRVDAEGHRVEYEYEENRLGKMTKPDGTFLEYTYEPYDGRMVTTHTRDEEGATEEFTYFPGYTEYRNPSGIPERHFFDERFRTTRIEYVDGTSVEMFYDEDDNLVRRIDERGQEWIFDHDEQGNVIYARDPNGHQERWEYNEFSQITRYVNQELHETVFEYDRQGNLRSVAYPDATGEAFTYDERGRVRSWTDRRNQTTSYEYDRYGNVRLVARPDGTSWHYTYDAYGNLTSEGDPYGNTTRYEYNNDNQVTAITYPPGGGSERFVYDNRKDLVEYRDRRGNMSFFDYDARHLLLTAVNPAGETTTFTYRPDGQPRSRSVDGITTIVYDYDSRGRLTGEEVRETGVRTSYTYTPRDELESVTDPRRSTTHYRYDAAGRLEAIVDPYQEPTLFSYYPDGELRRVTDRRGYSREYRYSETNQLTAEFDEIGVPHRYAWEGSLLDFEVDRNAERWDYRYEEAGRLVEVDVPGGGVESYTYDERGLRLSWQDLNGEVTRYAYDEAGRMISRSVPGTGSAWRYTYDEAANRTSATDPNGNTTRYAYDGLGRLERVTDPAGESERYAYNYLGNLTEVRDKAQQLWRFEFDESGRLRAAYNPLREATRYLPDPAGNVTEVTDAEERTTFYEYDRLGRLEQVRNALGEAYRYAYDEEGNLTAMRDPQGAMHRYAYDPRGLLSGETDRLGASASYEYDNLGNLIRSSSFAGDVTTLEYDRRSRLTAKHLPGGASERYEYDPVGRMTSAENANARLRFAYDPAGRLTTAENVTLGESFHYRYDAAGNRVSATRTVSGRTTSYTYTARNQIAAIRDADGNTTGMSYDPVGREVRRSLPNGITIARSYDPAGRLLTIAPSRFGADEPYAARGYVYNAAGQITARVDETGAVRLYDYDAAGRLTEVQYPFAEEKKKVDLVEQIRLGLIAPASEGEDDDLIPAHLAELLAADPAMLAGAYPVSREGTPFASPADLRGQAGALASRLREIAPGTNLQVSQYLWSERFTYDAKGNRTAVRNGWGITRYTYNAADRITQAGQRRYEHDGDGNLTREVLGSRDLRYRYDGEDRMIFVEGALLGWTDEGPQPQAMSYTYDALGRRLSREQDFRQGFRSGTIDTRYLYQGRSMSVAAELREVKLPAGFMPPGHEGSGGPPGQTGGPGGGPPAGVPGNTGGPGNPGGGPPITPPPFQDLNEQSAREYVLAGRMIIAHTDLVASPVHAQQTSWYHSDVRGSTMMLTGEHAEPKAAYSYDAYGVVYGEHPRQGIPQPAVPQVARPAVERGTEYLYTGKRFDPETGLADYGFRDYAASLARFTTMDPIRDGRNWFAYVEGDPINRIDLWGLATASDGEAVALDGSDLTTTLTGFQLGAGFILDVSFEVGLAIENNPAKPFLDRVDVYGDVSLGFFMGLRGNVSLPQRTIPGGIGGLDSRPAALSGETNIGVGPVLVFGDDGRLIGFGGAGIGGGVTVLSRTTSGRELLSDARDYIELSGNIWNQMLYRNQSNEEN